MFKYDLKLLWFQKSCYLDFSSITRVGGGIGGWGGGGNSEGYSALRYLRMIFEGRKYGLGKSVVCYAEEWFKFLLCSYIAAW